MQQSNRQRREEPLNFADAPTYERDGRSYVDREAALELAARIAASDANLLARLVSMD